MSTHPALLRKVIAIIYFLAGIICTAQAQHSIHVFDTMPEWKMQSAQRYFYRIPDDSVLSVAYSNNIPDAGTDWLHNPFISTTQQEHRLWIR